MRFSLQTKLKPQGDQAQAIKKLCQWIASGNKHQTLIGVTGSGKTFSMASVIAQIQKPTLVISHNKTLASQLYQEFRDFFPENAVHYFVSYYDYYQPEAYIPQTDTYIEKDASINEEIDRLRHGATQAVLERPDVIIVASVSCIYNIGSPEEYQRICLNLTPGQGIKRQELVKYLIRLQYERSDFELLPGNFRVRGEVVEIFPPTGEELVRFEFWGDTIEKILTKKDIFQGAWKAISQYQVFPAKHFITPQEKLNLALSNIRAELTQRLRELRNQGKLLEAQRLEQRTNYDLEMIAEVGYCTGIENYSRHLEFRKPGQPPWTLLDYFRACYSKARLRRSSPKDFLVIIDESHMTIPQLRGMYQGDKSRKKTLIEHGFRLPSALDNRPLTFSEFRKKVPQFLYVSATPDDYELKLSQGRVAQQLIRPTGLLEPEVEIRPTKNQIKDLLSEIRARAKKDQRVLITTLTKRSAENLTEFLLEKGIKAEYLHSEIETLERPEILYRLRSGEIEALVGINLLREGLDLPEVSLVAILDADKEGFLRSKITLIQTMGRAARNAKGKCIMYADSLTGSMKAAISEVKRRRKIQQNYNKKHHITPRTIKKEIKLWELVGAKKKSKEDFAQDIEGRLRALRQKDKKEIMRQLTQEMLQAAKRLEFEKAAFLRDKIRKLKDQPD